MDFAVKSKRQLKDMLEIIGQHSEATAMRQPIGVERNKRAAENGKQPKADPNDEKQPQMRPRGRPVVRVDTRERIDDTAKQHRLGKLRHGQGQIGERQEPAYSAVSPKVFENTAVKAKRIHLASGPCPSFVY